MDNMIIWSPGVTLEAVEKQVILAAFRHYRGNKTATSNALGIAIRTLDNKLEAYEQATKQQESADDKRKADREAFLIRARGTPTQQSPYLSSADARLRMEPADGASEEHALPVSQPKEVQKVLHEHSSKSRKARRR